SVRLVFPLCCFGLFIGPPHASISSRITDAEYSVQSEDTTRSYLWLSYIPAKIQFWEARYLDRVGRRSYYSFEYCWCGEPTVAFGIGLKRERELRGISLEEISKTTKISVRLLEAIEADRFDVLPEGVFRKSFIKSYAKYLGMNADQILHEYDLEVRPSVISQSAPEKTSVSLKDSSAGSRRVLLLVLGALLVALVGGYRFWYSSEESHKEESIPVTPSTSAAHVPIRQPHSETNLPAASSPVTPTTAPTGTEPTSLPSSAATPATTQPSSPAGPSGLKVLGELAKKPEPVAPPVAEGSMPLELTMEATNPVWVSVTSHESTIFAGLMNPS